MNLIAEILWEAAADVERRGVTRFPVQGEICATFAISEARSSFQHGSEARQILLAAIGSERPSAIPSIAVSFWNDQQPSRAVVAAAMRDAAFLAEWAGPHLLGGSK